MNCDFLKMVNAADGLETDEEIIARRLAKQDADFKSSRADYLSRVCPAEYLAFNADRCKNIEAHNAVVSAITARKSVIVIGKVGIGKTFAVWHALRLLIESGINPMIYTGVSFNAKASAACGADGGANEWVEWVYDTAVLVIDDWAKEAVTEAQERSFFEIIEKRSAQRRQTVLITNRTAREIVEQQHAAGRNTSRTEDILRRLVQRFTPIKFG